ncbi:MAG: tetratricopeptide repeat protein [Alphaproteobacteria bacterium]
MSDTAEKPALSPEQTQLLLRQAADALRARDVLRAEAALEQILAEQPEHTDALQAMGALRQMQGRAVDAEQFFRRAVASNPTLPQPHYNLGTVLYALAKHADAADAFRQAIRLKPNFVEAHLSLGLALQSLQQFEAAEKALREALRLQPNWLPLKQALSGVLNDQNRAKEAEALLRPAIAAARDPRQEAALTHNLGISLKLQRRYPEALDSLSRAQTLAPDLPLADYNRGNVLQQLGRLDEAMDAYRAAVGRNPLDLAAHRDLNHLLYRMQRNDEFLRSYDDAAALYPEVGYLSLNKASFLFRLGDYDAARENYERAAQLLPNHVTPHDGLALIHARTGDFDAAIREHELVLRMEPDNAHAHVNFAETLIRAGDAKKGLSAAEQAMAIAPDNQHALAMWGLALRSLDNAREEWLNDYERFVQVFEIAPPEGYADIESFNRDLNAYLNGLHRDKREFLGQTLRGGTQTVEDIFGADHDLVERLRARIDEAIAAYIARMKEDAEHPLLRRRQPAFRYAASWSSRLHDCGFHTNHVHPKGWISSAYYIAVPKAVEDSAGQEGWIKFGEPAFDTGFKEPVRRAIRPVPGTLVLFPSYMWHGTVPFHSAQSRTTIAFDAVPK